MYICNDCGEEFPEDACEFNDVSFTVPYGNGYVLKEEYERCCPECGSTRLEEEY